MRNLAAYSVHLFTASGIVFGFLALAATVEGDRFGAFVFLAISLFIDGIDGTMARAARVKTVTPHVDGTTLDNVIDYFTYVAVPALMVWHWELVPAGWGLAAGAAMMLASCYTYANANMKTTDSYFVGFPALWNGVVLYLILFGAGPWVALGVIAICVVLSFVPTAYIHPLRVTTLRPVSIAMTVVWTVALFWLIFTVLAMGQTLWSAPAPATALIVATLYFGAISLWRSFKKPSMA